MKQFAIPPRVAFAKYVISSTLSQMSVFNAILLLTVQHAGLLNVHGHLLVMENNCASKMELQLTVTHALAAIVTPTVMRASVRAAPGLVVRLARLTVLLQAPARPAYLASQATRPETK